MTRSRLIFPVLIALLLGVAGYVYWPGLHGGYQFDDYANLPNLGAFGPVTSWPVFWRYLTSGDADPTGRPIALLSFLLDAHRWPADPRPFLRTNLMLHLLNGVLLALFLRRLGKAWLGTTPAAVTRRMDMAAVLGASFWLLHPLWVSTTLYIVQREAMLPTTFTLLGLYAWLAGRQAFAQNHPLKGSLTLLAGLGAGTVLAVLSKANGILLPALALAIEHVLLRPLTSPPPKMYRYALGLLAWPAALLVAGYLLYTGWHGMVHGITDTRPWTMVQRLLTEPRILCDYLNLLWLPRPYTSGLFNDDIAASTSLLTPLSTLAAIIAVLGLIVGAWRLRYRHPALAAAIVFFFIGQSLESTTIPLELYFEHRNYLPALLMFWPLALWLCHAPVPSPRVSTKLKAAIAVILIAGLAGMTLMRANLWGNTRDQALLWAQLNPLSPRAQANAAAAEIEAGFPALAIARLRPLLQAYPDEPQFALNLLGAECQAGHLSRATLQASIRALRTTPRASGNTMLTSWTERMIQQTFHPPCPELNLVALTALLDAAGNNPAVEKNQGTRQDIDYLRGLIALAMKDAPVALYHFNQGLDHDIRPGAALQQAALLGAAGYPEQGVAHLDYFETRRYLEPPPPPGMPRIHAWILAKQHYWNTELLRLRRTLINDERAKHAQAP